MNYYYNENYNENYEHLLNTRQYLIDNKTLSIEWINSEKQFIIQMYNAFPNLNLLHPEIKSRQFRHFCKVVDCLLKDLYKQCHSLSYFDINQYELLIEYIIIICEITSHDSLSNQSITTLMKQLSL
jgi:hypothetical protein